MQYHDGKIGMESYGKAGTLRGTLRWNFTTDVELYEELYEELYREDKKGLCAFGHVRNLCGRVPPAKWNFTIPCSHFVPAPIFRQIWSLTRYI